MKVGDSLSNKIQKGIRESSYLAIILSPNSVNSPWVKRELNAALAGELDKKDIFILPIYFRQCEIPVFLKDRVYADFREDFNAGLIDLLARFN